MIVVADVAVTVRNAAESARWWREKVGFDVFTVGAPGGHALMVTPPGERFLLHLCEGFGDLEPGNTGIAFVTDRLRETTRRMEAAGVEFPEPFRGPGPGGTAKFADPDGNIFWLLGAPTAFIRSQTRRRGRTGGRKGPLRAAAARRPRLR